MTEQLAETRPSDPAPGAENEPRAAMARRSRAPLPESVGPYQIHGVLGAGGMGAVYDAVSPSGDAVALKVVRASLTSLEALRRFERESSVRIDHPNVVRVLDAGTDEESQPFMVLERLSGEPLSEATSRGAKFSVPNAVDIVVQACRGLEAAHAAGVVHRDLKPSNLFVCENGTIKLLDFGVAVLASAESRLTITGQVVGTIYYLSPEQAERSSTADARSDLWSLGAVLYELLAGRPPFSEDTATATLVAIMMGQPTPLRSLRPDVPPALAQVIERALEKTPARRWQSATQMREALENLDNHDGQTVLLTDADADPYLETKMLTSVDTHKKRRSWILPVFAAAAFVAAFVGSLSIYVATTRSGEVDPGEGSTGAASVPVETPLPVLPAGIDVPVPEPEAAIPAPVVIAEPAVEERVRPRRTTRPARSRARATRPARERAALRTAWDDPVAAEPVSAPSSAHPPTEQRPAIRGW